MRARAVGKKSPAIQRDNVLGNPLKMFPFPVDVTGKWSFKKQTVRNNATGCKFYLNL